MEKDNSVIHTIRIELSEIFSADDAIVAAYIFGSIAKKTDRPLSDVDIAVLLDETKSKNFSILEIVPKIEKKLGRDVDVVVLNKAGDVLKYEVRRDGVLIYDRNPEIRKKFEILGRKTYEDFIYLHNRYVRKVVYEVSNG